MPICPVRGCRLPLERTGGRAVCGRGHSFDFARSGYLNLLQPQDRRSKRPGDPREAVAARRRLHDRGVAAPVLEAVRAMAAITAGDTVLEAGCGEGYFLGSLARLTGCRGCGLDLAAAALDLAARRYPECEWVAANADRLVPYPDRFFSVVLSIAGRMNPGEFRRVLREDGRLLVAVSAPDDLIELRGRGRDRVDRTIRDFAPAFELAARRGVSTQVELDAEGVADVLRAIYRPFRSAPVEAMRVTFSFDLLLFRAARPAGSSGR
jgi:23S rRNA (guanine745-N1)-methyltransferase